MPRHTGLPLLLLNLALLVSCAAPAGAEETLTARKVFAMLPESIFESTMEGLEPADKQELLATGRTAFWEIAGETDEVMVFAALPLRETAVALRLFRHDRGHAVEAALGTLDDENCILELWHVDESGRAVPVDTPDEPDVREFFPSGGMPRNVHGTTLFCLGLGGLKAEPRFWDSQGGKVHLPVANSVGFQWNGRRFEKVALPPSAAGTAPEK